MTSLMSAHRTATGRIQLGRLSQGVVVPRNLFAVARSTAAVEIMGRIEVVDVRGGEASLGGARHVRTGWCLGAGEGVEPSVIDQPGRPTTANRSTSVFRMRRLELARNGRTSPICQIEAATHRHRQGRVRAEHDSGAVT